MQLEIHSRHFTLADEMKEKIVAKLENLQRYSPSEPVATRLTLTLEGGRFVGDMTLNLKQNSCHAKVEHVEPDGAAFMAIESVERQLRRIKDKLKDHRGRSQEGGLGAIMSEQPGGLLDNPGSALLGEGFELRDLTIDQAKESYRDSSNPFYVFRNLETGEVNVLYRKDDGEFGMMIPEA